MASDLKALQYNDFEIAGYIVQVYYVMAGVNCRGVHLVFSSENNCNSTYLSLLVSYASFFCSCKLIVLVFLRNLVGEHCRYW